MTDLFSSASSVLPTVSLRRVMYLQHFLYFTVAVVWSPDL